MPSSTLSLWVARGLAITLVSIGILGLVFAGFAYRDLRIAMSGVSSDSVPLKVVASGLLDSASANPRFWRQVESRLFFLFGVGFLLSLIGGVLLFWPKKLVQDQ